MLLRFWVRESETEIQQNKDWNKISAEAEDSVYASPKRKSSKTRIETLFFVWSKKGLQKSETEIQQNKDWNLCILELTVTVLVTVRNGNPAKQGLKQRCGD